MITYVILFLTVAFSLYAMNNPEIKYKYIFILIPFIILNNIIVFVSCFLHGDYLHLAFNMYALWMFGPIIEKGVLPILLGVEGEPNYKLGIVFIFYFIPVLFMHHLYLSILKIKITPIIHH